ncbi:LPD1 domain-containing protein [Paraburkholderia sp. SIMBA_054]|uniref:LPD1 domain-containing protein n=1 Tax=Paraburkholderia sp. SIMBA_054 TaxID=3085795 RepID=UPI00397A6E24
MNHGKLSSKAPEQFTLPLFDFDEKTACRFDSLPRASTSAVVTVRTVEQQPRPVVERAKDAPTPVASVVDTQDVNDPRSAVYRFRDTGFIEGSRKEAAASMVILRAKKDGSRVFTTSIDWGDLEKNPREARNLITKSNLFGEVDWAALREGGMQSGAGFLIDRIYAAIGQEPAVDSPAARKDYATGLQTLRDRLEACKTPAEILTVLNGLQEEFDGAVYLPEETREFKAISERDDVLLKEYRALEASTSAAYDKVTHAKSDVDSVDWEIKKRDRRGWATKPELSQKLAEANAIHSGLNEEWSRAVAQATPRKAAIRKERTSLHDKAYDMRQAARQRNILGNPLCRAWALMGERFVNVLQYRKHKGSDAFAKHVTAAKTGKIADWSWLGKEVMRAPRVTSEAARFQIRVAETYEREGGRAVAPQSTAELKTMFNLRDLQSGNWVLRDIASAQFHTEQSGASFADLADLLGIADQQISFQGRLALAFGARGQGAKGWKSGAAAAHYETVHRVINITKMKGGGSLGHEWFHAFDNLIAEVLTGQPAGVADFVSANPSLLPQGEMRDAIVALRNAMLDGPHQLSETLHYSAEDFRRAGLNINEHTERGIGALIKAAGNVHAAVQAVDAKLGPNAGEKLTGRSKRNHETWRGIAIAYYGGNAGGGEIEVRSGPTMSSFALEAHKLDQGGKVYYRATYEMAARAFQSWIEDRLSGLGRRNDYLSVFASNEHYVDALLGIQWKPYPEGDERQRINAAFARLAGAIRHALAD